MNLADENVRFRPIEVADLERFRFWAKDPDFCYPCTNLNWPLRNEEFGLLLSPNDSFRLFALDGNKMIGFAGYLATDWKNRQINLVWGMEKTSDFQAGVVQMLVDFAFNELNLQRIETEIREDENETAKILEELGFELEGVKRESFHYQGKYFNAAVWAKLLPEDKL